MSSASVSARPGFLPWWSRRYNLKQAFSSPTFIVHVVYHYKRTQSGLELNRENQAQMPVGAHTESVVYNPKESWVLLTHVQKNSGFSLMPRHSAVFEPWRTLGILSVSSCFLQAHSCCCPKCYLCVQWEDHNHNQDYLEHSMPSRC